MFEATPEHETTFSNTSETWESFVISPSGSSHFTIMESVSECLSKPLPALLKTDSTITPSTHPSQIAHDYLHHWSTFETEALAFLATCDLTKLVPNIDSMAEESVLTGNEHGLVGRFKQHLGVAFTNVTQVMTEVPSLRFGDHQSMVNHVGSDGADLVIGQEVHGEYQLRVVGELKTWWTFSLKASRVNDSLPQKKELAKVLGKSKNSSLAVMTFS